MFKMTFDGFDLEIPMEEKAFDALPKQAKQAILSFAVQSAKDKAALEAKQAKGRAAMSWELTTKGMIRLVNVKGSSLSGIYLTILGYQEIQENQAKLDAWVKDLLAREAKGEKVFSRSAKEAQEMDEAWEKANPEKAKERREKRAAWAARNKK